MKKIILTFVFACITIAGQAQETTTEKQVEVKQINKNKSVEFKVYGNCDMCKKRIEKAAYKVKGVKQATWHADDQDIHLIIDETKCTIEQIQQAIAAVGHDTEGIKATKTQYENLHGCCKYREQEVH